MFDEWVQKYHPVWVEVVSSNTLNHPTEPSYCGNCDFFVNEEEGKCESSWNVYMERPVDELSWKRPTEKVKRYRLKPCEKNATNSCTCYRRKQERTGNGVLI